MILRSISLLAAAAALAASSVASAAAAPIPARVSAPVASADYQDGVGGGPVTVAVILGLIVALLIAVAAISGDGDPESP